jgi:hydroxymethyl cephem carbamoyltransferase
MAAMVADLAAGEVVAFVQGRCEIGPRSLGHRSLLAYAADPGAKDRLNAVKRREDYRPIAPLCRERDAPTYFEGTAPAEHMLFTRLVRDRRLAAVTHVDGSARLQTVDDESAGHLSAVFAAMADAGLVPVLCNTSLNFKGRGFVNRVSDLAAYAAEQDLVGYAIDGTYYRRGR